MPILTNLLLLCDILSKENKIILFLLFIFINMSVNPLIKGIVLDYDKFFEE